MPTSNYTFEQCLAEAQLAEEKLSQADVPLEEALAIFTEGAKALKKAQSFLENIEGQVFQLTVPPDPAGSDPKTPKKAISKKSK